MAVEVIPAKAKRIDTSRSRSMDRDEGQPAVLQIHKTPEPGATSIKTEHGGLGYRGRPSSSDSRAWETAIGESGESGGSRDGARRNTVPSC